MANSKGSDRADDLRQAWWELHEVEQLLAGLRATPAQRLAWLEEMLEIAHQVGARRLEDLAP